MTSHIATDRGDNLIGSSWMVAAMAGFAVEDMFLKGAAQAIPIGQVLIIFGVGGAVVFVSIAKACGEPLYPPEVLSRPMQVRVLFEIVGRLFYGLAIALTPLSAATVILQATPLVVVAGAALIFGEKIGWRRWSAILVGLAGVLIIVRPGTESFSVLSILAVIGMIGFAGRDLASRAAPASLSSSVLGVYGFLAIVVAGGLYAFWDGGPLVWPDSTVSLLLVAAILAGVFGYSSLMKGMRTGEVAAVTPFSYTRLLFGIGLGIAVFGEELSANMILGCGLIVLSGLFILWRGQQAVPGK